MATYKHETRPSLETLLEPIVVSKRPKNRHKSTISAATKKDDLNPAEAIAAYYRRREELEEKMRIKRQEARSTAFGQAANTFKSKAQQA